MAGRSTGSQKNNNPSYLVSWSLTSLFSKNMAISETKGQGGQLSVMEGQQYINLNPGRLFVQQPPKKEKGSRGSLKLIR